jgi:hypothetical protein
VPAMMLEWQISAGGGDAQRVELGFKFLGDSSAAAIEDVRSGMGGGEGAAVGDGEQCSETVMSPWLQATGRAGGARRQKIAGGRYESEREKGRPVTPKTGDLVIRRLAQKQATPSIDHL